MTHRPIDRLRHDLHTPLNHIIGYIELLLEDADTEDAAIAEATTVGTVLVTLHGRARSVLVAVDQFFESLEPGAGSGSGSLAGLALRLESTLTPMLEDIDALIANPADSNATVAAAQEDLLRIRSAVQALRSLLGADVTPASEVSFCELDPAPKGRASRPTMVGAILVVDDDADNRQMLARRLSRDGHHLTQVASGSEALEALAAGGIDLVLLDVMMPGLDGYGVLQQLKASETWRELPVLMISALDEAASVARCIELGADDFLAKPFDPVILRARIGACLEKKRLRDREANHLQELAQWNLKLEERVADQVAALERLGRLKRFFSPQLAELILAGGADDPLLAHRREVTVCFLDLRGFTAFAEDSEPEEVMSVLRQFHAEMGRLIMSHEGTLERFTGDGMMVFFNDPVLVENPAGRAVRMALAMRDSVAGLAIGWRRMGYELDLGIGIAQGFATLGAIGFEGRWDYGAIGSVTNLAARLCAEAGPGQVLASRRIVALTEDIVSAEPIGALALKGFHRAVPTFSLGARQADREGPA